jgi:hypothetical protein
MVAEKKILPVGAATYLAMWNKDHDISKLYVEFSEEMDKTGKLPFHKQLPNTSCFGDSIWNSLSVYKEFDLKARKLSKLTKGELPENWFQDKIRSIVLNDPEIMRSVHCFDGCFKGGWRPYPSFTDWCVFCDFWFDETTGNVNTSKR